MTRWLALVPFLMLACSSEEDPPTDAEVLADLEGFMDGYDSWSQTDDWTGEQPSTSIHGDTVQIWYNTAAFNTVTAAASEMPDGSIVVKEGYDSEGAVNAVTTMYKVENYGWFWAVFDDAGVVGDHGQLDGCESCHSDGKDMQLAEQDW